MQDLVIKNEIVDEYSHYIVGAERTTESYISALKNLKSYLEQNNIIKPMELDMINYRKYLMENYKSTTAQNYFEACKLFFKWLSKKGIYPNITDDIKPVKINREQKRDYFRDNEIETICNSIDKNSLKGSRDFAMIFLALTNGLRASEIVNINMADIEMRNNQMFLYITGKGRTEREKVAISKETEQVIKNYLFYRMKESFSVTNNPLFVSLNHKTYGERIHVKALSRLIKNIYISCGFDSEKLTLHSLRHTACTKNSILGAPLEENSTFMRHNQVTTTMNYIHSIDKENNPSINRLGAYYGNLLLGDITTT